MTSRKDQVDGSPRRSPLARRSLLALGAGGLASVAVARMTFRDPPIETRPIDGLAPFRRLDRAAETSTPAATGAAVLIGIDRPDPVDPQQLAALRDDPCPALFGPEAEGAAVPVAYFSDIRCPWCRAIETRLAVVADRNGVPLRIADHDWPVFGEASRLAARAIVAADRLGQGGAMRDRLRRARAVIDTAYIDHVAGAIGLDPARLAAEMASRGTDARLAESRALARIFGFVGTPALVVGRIAFSGAISEDALAQVIAAAEPGRSPCRQPS